ncbi:MAG: MerR family transcriptional regulator [Alphaproteobacteria bacterium]|nr:MerR family transcriptional regulator [Alphaproteobacteria bacterium]
MVEKSPDAFRNISEVSSLLNVPAHVLRFWETRFSQIKPVKRSGGRRYYRPEDITLLTRIRDLLYAEGYTIKGAQQVLKSGAAEAPQTPVSPPGGEGADDAAQVDAAQAHAQVHAVQAPADGDVAAAMALLKEAAHRLDRLAQSV